LFTASPLAVVRTVIKDKSTASLPFFTSLVIWFNTTSWLFYGYLVANDVLIWGPNVLGFGLASLQMCLFSVYGTGKSLEPKPRKRVVGKIAAHHEV
jgi:solute carrier family 50 protein (sugar transporter)